MFMGVGMDNERATEGIATGIGQAQPVIGAICSQSRAGIRPSARRAPHLPRTTRVPGYRMVQILEYIRATIDVDGIAPSYGMIRDEFGFASKGKVADYIRRLEKYGLIARVGSGRVRRIRLVGVESRQPDEPTPAPKPAKPTPPDGYLTTEEAMVRAKVTRAIFERWCLNGEIDFVRVLGRRYFAPEVVSQKNVGRIKQKRASRKYAWKWCGA